MTEGTEHRYSDICGATNSRGESCKLPAGWGTPSSQGRCKFHGGSSTGPAETDYLEGNDHAEGNPGGGAPEGNTNSRIHGGFSDWRTEYKRLEAGRKKWVDELAQSMIEASRETAPDLSSETREALAKERATLSLLLDGTELDIWGKIAGDDSSRGFSITKTVEKDGEESDIETMNPAFDAAKALRKRRREIREELNLYADQR